MSWCPTGLAIALGGILRDLVARATTNDDLGAAIGYQFVYGLEVVLLLVTLVAMIPLLRRTGALARVG